jgi:SAM-dependent methyltransferase
MSPVHPSPADSADRSVAEAYDSFAEAYSADSEASLQNGYYTHPAIVNLAGDVAGRRILDAGCGSGPIAVKLRDRGATVAGFDSSAAMLELARKRLGPDTDLRLADLASPLPYPDGAFDDVIAGPGAALPAGLDRAAGRAAARAGARRAADRGRRPPLPHYPDAPHAGRQSRLFRDPQLDR